MKKNSDKRVHELHLYIADEADVRDLHPLEVDQLSVEEQNLVEVLQEELDKFPEDDLDGRTITIRGDRLKAKLDEKIRQQPATQRQVTNAAKKRSNMPLVVFKPQ
jgi:hypothetical protein